MGREDRPVLIIWILEDWQNIPKLEYFDGVHKKLHIALNNDGFDGSRTYLYIIVDPNSPVFSETFPALHQKYLSNNIYLENGKFEGDKLARLNWVFVDILRHCFVQSTIYGTAADVVLISVNENFGQGTKFSAVRNTLVKLGFNVYLVNPDTLLKMDENTCIWST